MMRVDAQVNVPGVNAMMFSVRNGYKKGQDSKHQNDQSDDKEDSHIANHETTVRQVASPTNACFVGKFLVEPTFKYISLQL